MSGIIGFVFLITMLNGVGGFVYERWSTYRRRRARAS